jgi:hypothetical protein
VLWLPAVALTWPWLARRCLLADRRLLSPGLATVAPPAAIDLSGATAPLDMSTPRSHQASRDSANVENLAPSMDTQPQPASSPGYWSSLTAKERRYVLVSRCSSVLTSVGFALGSAATLARKLELVGGHIGQYASATATVQSGISAMQLLLGPSVASLSDTVGRRPLQLTSSIAMMLWHLFLANRRICSSIFRYQAFAVFCMGICSAGSLSVKQAALDDLFGSRPSIAAQIASQNMFWISVFGFVAPLVGAEIARRAPHTALQLAASVCVLQLPLLLATPETLVPEDRKPFRPNDSNPLSNVLVLFKNGPGLRGLAIVNVMYNGCNGAFANISEYAMGSCGWVPADVSYLNSGQGLLQAFAFQQVFPRMLRRFGARGAFQLGSLASASALMLLSLAWRGGSKWWCTLLIALSFVVQVPGLGNPVALRTITTKQGLSVARSSRGGGGKTSAVGRGELSAALASLSSLVSIASPLVWGSIFRLCQRVGKEQAAWWYNPGGGFMLAAIGRLGIRLVFSFVCDRHADDLVIDDD